MVTYCCLKVYFNFLFLFFSIVIALAYLQSLLHLGRPRVTDYYLENLEQQANANGNIPGHKTTKPQAEPRQTAQAGVSYQYVFI